MPTETAAGVTIGLKSGLFAGAAAIMVSILAVFVGFGVFPPTPGKVMEDIARRLAAGLFSSFTLGIFLALKCITAWPEVLLDPWIRVLAGYHMMVAYLAAAAPFLALAALPGFWIVGGVMRWFAKRANQDIGEMARDAKNDVTSVIGK